MKKLDSFDIPAGDEDDLLAQPTRRRLFALLGELRRAASTDELAGRLGIHPNGARAHLQRMRAAGLVERRRVVLRRGRPRDEWSISPTARPRGARPEAYRSLASWLARSVPATPGRLREVEAAGREIGRELAARSSGSAERALVDTLAAQGFQPLIDHAADGRVRCRLRNCPYRDSVRANQPVVCTLHRGITRGLLDALAPDAVLAAFVPHDPDAAGCEIEIDGLVPPP